jgi:hypothetical protein
MGSYSERLSGIDKSPEVPLFEPTISRVAKEGPCGMAVGAQVVQRRVDRLGAGTISEIGIDGTVQVLSDVMPADDGLGEVLDGADSEVSVVIRGVRAFAFCTTDGCDFVRDLSIQSDAPKIFPKGDARIFQEEYAARAASMGGLRDCARRCAAERN